MAMRGELIDLRRRAEERLRRRGTHPPADIAVHALAHELEVAQLEVDLQREEIEASRDRYVALCDSAPAAILMLDAHSRILDGNTTAQLMLGIDPPFGQPLTRFFDEPTADRLQLQLRRAEYCAIDVAVRPARGAPYDAFLVLEPARGAVDAFRAVLVRKMAPPVVDEPSLIPTHATHVDPSSVRILVVDDNEANRALAVAALEDEGYQPLAATGGAQAIEMAARELPDCIVMDVRMPGVDGIAACEKIRALPGGGAIAIVFVTAQRDVETFDRALAVGGDDFIAKPFRPAELLVRVQTALRLRRFSSERSELFEQLKHERDALMRLELQKEQLVAFLVHDLKNPVYAIDLHAQAVLRASQLERAHAVARLIHDDTTSLMRMITNLLDLSKADEGRLVPAKEPVDTVDLVRSVLDVLIVRAESSGVRISSELTVREIVVDRDLMSRVLANLVDNAIRYSPEGSEVRIMIVPTSSGIEVRVADEGPGVPLEERDRVFERFRSNAATTTRTNRGLGLAFCKQAIEAQGGRIWIEDGNPGAVFCVSLASS